MSKHTELVKSYCVAADKLAAVELSSLDNTGDLYLLLSKTKALHKRLKREAGLRNDLANVKSMLVHSRPGDIEVVLARSRIFEALALSASNLAGFEVVNGTASVALWSTTPTSYNKNGAVEHSWDFNGMYDVRAGDREFSSFRCLNSWKEIRRAALQIPDPDENGTVCAVAKMDVLVLIRK